MFDLVSFVTQEISLIESVDEIGMKSFNRRCWKWEWRKLFSIKETFLRIYTKLCTWTKCNYYVKFVVCQNKLILIWKITRAYKTEWMKSLMYIFPISVFVMTTFYFICTMSTMNIRTLISKTFSILMGLVQCNSTLFPSYILLNLDFKSS